MFIGNGYGVVIAATGNNLCIGRAERAAGDDDLAFCCVEKPAADEGAAAVVAVKSAACDDDFVVGAGVAIPFVKDIDMKRAVVDGDGVVVDFTTNCGVAAENMPAYCIRIGSIKSNVVVGGFGASPLSAIRVEEIRGISVSFV
ncbi:hypothetical protein FACS1894116_02480 [Betaproteobacteria bacterium]|nr:hypothetical protein FACS1894116_02480 [Betaproteobacteria bacterium]GHU30236.1 hypothetical protein FACS189497_09660 [Betaproteobacteria bacterium]